MRKCWIVFAALMLAAPAMAADWSFFGSERMATYYNYKDFGDTQVAGQDNDAGTLWFFQGNSRFGAKVKADKVSGYIELATQASSTDSAGDGGVNTRRAYGVWQFADNASLKVGKDYSPVTDNNMSNQVFDADNNLEGNGLFYGRRPSYIGLYLGGFEFAALTPAYGQNPGTTQGTSPNLNGVQGATNGDPDAYLPKFEAAYQWKFDAGYIRPFGGFQYYKIAPAGTGTVTDRLDIYSYVLGIGGQVEHRRLLSEQRIRLGTELEFLQLVFGRKRRHEQPALFEDQRPRCRRRHFLERAAGRRPEVHRHLEV